LNVIHIMGNLGGDPELTYTQGGTPICKFSVATKETWTDKAGQKQEKTEWHRVVFFGRRAEVVAEFFSKGKPILIEGSMTYNQYTTADGVQKTSSEIKGERFHFVASGGGSSERQGNNQRSNQSNQSAEADFDQSFNDDDIPF